MKKLLSFIMVIGLAILLFQIYKPKNPVTKLTPSYKSNQVIGPTPLDEIKTKEIKAKKKTVDVTEQIQEKSNYQKKDEEEDELDYVTAYRDWEYFANCFTDVEDFHNKKDPLETLAERFEHNPRESQNEPSPQQNSYYQHHVEICKSLTDNEKDDFYQIREKLYAKFLKISPKTAQEKQLEHALEIVKQMGSFNYELSRAYNSKSTLTKEELISLSSQIEDLTKQMITIYESSEELSETQLAEITELNALIKVIKNHINSSKEVDTAALLRIEKNLDGFINSMDDYLHQVQSPDAFLLIAQSVYKARYYQSDSTLIRHLKNQTGIKDSYYINILNSLVLPLVACSMNYPCDAESDIMLSYCLGLKDSMFNQACGRTLEDFYFSFYIGANQLNDVNIYFSYMVSKYAQ